MTTKTKPKPRAGSPAPDSSETPWLKTCRLLHVAVMAVDELAEHLKNVPDKPRMHAANRALHELWKVEPPNAEVSSGSEPSAPAKGSTL